MPDLNRIWEDDTQRAIDALSNRGVKITRTVDDRVTFEFSLEEWAKMFNVGDGYVGCGPEWKPFSNNKVYVRFVRNVKEDKNA